MNKLFKINDYELLSQKVYRILKKGIIIGDFKPGEKILEVKIAEQLGVSRTPIREALRELVAEGFVKMSPHRGMIVSTISIEDIREALQIRGVLEGLTACLAAKLINREEIKKLEKFLKQMEYYTNKDDVLTFSKMDAKFHELILNICGNNRLIQMREKLSDQTHRYRMSLRSLSIPGRLKYSLEEHREIVEALKRKDSKQADRLSQKHIKNVLENILAHKGKEEDKNKDA
jgi:DNA-binding GntR family transcriptional regulator